MNLSIVSDEETANTNTECAHQRAENLSILGIKNVIELCVGPSLATLKQAYIKHGINVTGNDIDKRWSKFSGPWILGDALSVSLDGFDCAVFAPPLSFGCTGKRTDALMIEEVNPSYNSFISKQFSGLKVLVLPARSLATSYDRQQLYKLLSVIRDAGYVYDIVELKAGRRRITKYIDVYLRVVK